MKIERLLIYAILLTVCLTGNLFAGDQVEMNFIGFSKDGKYLAFEEIESSEEGWEFENDTTYILDTAKNSFVVAPVVFKWDEKKPAKLESTFRRRYKRHVAANLKRFGIVRDNLGQLVVSHLLYDWSYVKPVESEQFFTQSDGTQTTKMMTDYQGGYVPKAGCTSEKIIFNPSPSDFVANTSEFYELTLVVAPDKCRACDAKYRIELTLKDNMHHKDRPLQILQKDTDKLPDSRQDAFAYKIERVFVYSNKIAVFLLVFSPGFEGIHIGNMVVTGEFEW